MKWVKYSSMLMYIYFIYLFYFFFQAEDGIRDDLVTGVQTCALPIWLKEEDYVGFPLNMCRFNVKYYYYTSYRTNQIGEPITFEEQNGKVKAEEVYDTEGQLVKSTSNTYKFLSKGRIGGIKLFMRPASYFREHRFRVDAFQNYIHELRVHEIGRASCRARG